MRGPVLRRHHYTALMVISIGAILALTATGYARFLFLVMPFVFIFGWAQRRRKLISNSVSDGSFPVEPN